MASRSSFYDSYLVPEAKRGDPPHEPRGYKAFVKQVRERVKVDIPIVDIFCGAGGSTLGALWAGFEPKIVVDVDANATATFFNTFVKKFKLTPKILTKDTREITDGKKLDLDGDFVLVGCPPCQGFSTVGKRDPNDERNELVYHFLKFVKTYRPLVVTFENVAGMRRHEVHSMRLADGLRCAGYDIVFGLSNGGELDSIDLAYYGVPQHRRRVVVVASRDQRFSKHFEPPRPFRFTPRLIEKYELGDEYALETVREWIGDLPPIDNGGEDPSVPNHRAPNLQKTTLRRIKVVPKNGGSLKDAPEEYWIPCHRGDPDTYRDILGRLRWDSPSVTIKGSFVSPTTGRYVHPEQDRGISVREGARLQTFPDYFEFPNKIRTAAKLIGNALPPRFSYVLMRQIRVALEAADLT